MKKILFILIALIFSNCCAMKKGDEPANGGLLVRPLSIVMRLRPDNSMTIKKMVYISVQPSKSQVGTVCGMSESVANGLLATWRGVEMFQENNAAQNALRTFTAIMTDIGNVSGKATISGNEKINLEMYNFLKAQQSKFIFNPSTKQLLLHEDLGVHEGGWAFDKIMELNLSIEDKTPLPALTIQYHHMQKNVHGKVKLDDLVAGSKKDLAEKFKALTVDASKSEDEKHAAEVALIVVMSLTYITSLSRA